MAAAVELTVNVTGTVTVRPAPVMLTDPLYVPAPSGARFDVTLIVAGVVPVVGETVNHDPPDTLAVNVVLGDAETLKLCVAGELPPTVAENDSEAGLTEKL